MKPVIVRYLLMLCLAAAVLVMDVKILPTSEYLVGTAEAVIGRPATPVSYAGVARRSTVGVGAPGVGAAPANRGGPVNRVGRR